MNTIVDEGIINEVPMISVIVATYNSSETVIETLESIKNQTYPNIEIVITDDASTDDTIRKCESWITENGINGLVVKAEYNSGIVANVNKGIRVAKGNPVKILAGDDILCNEAIDRFFYYYLKDKGILWQAKISCFGVNQDRIREVESKMSNYDFFLWTNKAQYKALSSYNPIVSPSLGLIDKRLFELFGYYDESIPMLEDYPFNLKMSKNGICFRLINEQLVKYRISESSVSGALSKSFCQSMTKFFFKNRMRALIENKCFGELVKQTVKYLLLLFNILIIKENSKYRFKKL